MFEVSVIVCSYNDSHFLKTCLPSCVKQDLDLEVVVIDDGSAQFDAAILAMINGHENMRYLRHGKNLGLSESRNTGIAVARSEYVIPLDADDWFYPNTVKGLFDSREDFDIVTGNCTDNGVYRPAISREPLSEALFLRENPLVCSSLFKKSIWARVGGYSLRKGYEDYRFWAQCFAQGARFKYVDLNVYEHTSRPDGMLRQLHPEREYYHRMATEGVFTCTKPSNAG